jgi:Phage tail protein
VFTKVEIRTSQGSLLTLPLGDATGGLIIQEIQGLDPVKATLVSSSFAQLDGSQYHSSRRESRNIKITLGLEPDYGLELVGDLRRRLYNFLMPKTEVSLRFHTYDERIQNVLERDLDVDILGRIESFETALFTKDPAVDISLVCFDPDFYDPIPVEISDMTVNDLTETVLNYIGTVETGIKFTLSVDRSISEFTIYHRPSDGSLRTLDFAAPLLANDVLTINTVVGNKSVILVRDGVESSLVYALSPQSNWIELQPGDNYIRVYAEGVPIPFEIEYTTKYGGL